MTQGSLLNYLIDSNGLITLIMREKASVRPLTRLVSDGRLRSPQSVIRECRRRADRLRAWIDRNPGLGITETTERMHELARIGHQYSDVLGDNPRAADFSLVALAVHYGSWIVVSDDTGVEIACMREGIRQISVRAFRQIEHL